MAAATHPHIQAQAQAQIDEVVGRDRGPSSHTRDPNISYMGLLVPTFDDEKLLPLVVAFYLETFRWRPISWGGESPLDIRFSGTDGAFPAGVAHRATSDILWARAPFAAVPVPCVLIHRCRENMSSLPEPQCMETTGEYSNFQW